MKQNNKPLYQLTLTEEEANLVSRACEFYARVRMGQFGEIPFWCTDMRGPEDSDATQADWLALRKQIYPDLNGVGHSYGMGKFKDADKAFDVHQVIRHALGAPRKPFSYNKLPKCEKLKPNED